MKNQAITFEVSPEIGSVSGEFDIPDTMKAILTLAHGAGAGFNHPFMKKLALTLCEKNIGTLRFNFPFIEKKKKIVDRPPIAELTIQRAIEKVKDVYPDVPLFASGKSFGGRMTSHLLSKNFDLGVRGIIFFGFPLHAPGNPGVERATHLMSVKIPMLFLQGTNDALATMPLIQQVTNALPNTTLVLYEKADHSFKANKRELIPELADQTSAWSDFFI
jgi:predicted alpha/beta-hydrolase family hydrolase